MDEISPGNSPTVREPSPEKSESDNEENFENDLSKLIAKNKK